MILNEQAILEFKCELEALITQREAMVAENHYRIRRGETIAYGEDAFNNLTLLMRDIKEKIIHLDEKVPVV